MSMREIDISGSRCVLVQEHPEHAGVPPDGRCGGCPPDDMLLSCALCLDCDLLHQQGDRTLFAKIAARLTAASAAAAARKTSLDDEYAAIRAMLERLALGDPDARITLPEDAIEAVRDVTEFKKAEADRDLLKNQLHHAQKLDSIGQLAGGIAHEFNNILAAILGYAGILEKRLGADSPNLTAVHRIISASEKAASLTHSMLTFSRKQIVGRERSCGEVVSLGVEQEELGCETILVGEDNEDVRPMIVELLQDIGYRVLEARDGTEVVSLMEDFGDTVDLLLLDVIMPRMNGYEALSVVRQRYPELPCLFLSGYSDDVLKQKAKISGTFEYLSKPVMPDRLIAALRAALDGREPKSFSVRNGTPPPR